MAGRFASLVLLAAVAAAATDPPPTREEIRNAYLSKKGGLGSRFLFWDMRNDRFGIREVRGWQLRFRHLRDDRQGGLLLSRYQAIARKKSQCAEYAVVQSIPTSLGAPNRKTQVHVEDLGGCR